VITGQTVDKVLSYFESEMTPLNGRKIVVKAWTDPHFAARVVDDTPAAIGELDLPEGMAGAEGEHLQAVANTPGGAQPDHLHAVLVLSVAGARAAAVLVQRSGLSGAGRP